MAAQNQNRNSNFIPTSEYYTFLTELIIQYLFFALTLGYPYGGGYGGYGGYGGIGGYGLGHGLGHGYYGSTLLH